MTQVNWVQLFLLPSHVSHRKESGLSKQGSLGVLKLFPDISVALEQICIFTTSILVELALLVQMHYLYELR